MHVDLTRASTPLAMSSLPGALSNQMPLVVTSTNFSMLSPDPGIFLAILPGASYKLEHCDKHLKNEKKRASDLSTCPTESIPFQTVNGADTRYGQIYKPILAHPFKEAGIAGFTPIQPFKVAKNILAQTDQCAAFHWPSLSKFNDDIAPSQWANNAEYECYMSGDSISTLPVLTTGPPPAAPNHSIPSVPAIQLLTAAITKSMY
jgi:hypothetical protein